MTSKWRRRLCITAIALASINFATFIIAGFVLGGDAGNGRVENGHYYLNFHGTYTEVSKTVYAYSWWHSFSLPFTFVLFAVAAYFGRSRERGSLSDLSGASVTMVDA